MTWLIPSVHRASELLAAIVSSMFEVLRTEKKTVMVNYLVFG